MAGGTLGWASGDGDLIRQTGSAKSRCVFPVESAYLQLEHMLWTRATIKTLDCGTNRASHFLTRRSSDTIRMLVPSQATELDILRVKVVQTSRGGSFLRPFLTLIKETPPLWSNDN